MSNLFATATNFTDDQSNTPPAAWNGASYVVVNMVNDFTLNISPAPGDTIEFTGSDLRGSANFLIQYTDSGGDNVELLGAPLTTTPTLYSVVLPTGGTNYFVDVDAGVGDPPNTATLTPASTPPPPIPTDCGELGRVTRSFVSGYTAARPEVRRIRRFSKRCLVAEFNGAMPLGCTIIRARFDTTSPWSMFMSNPRIQSNQRSIAIDVSFNFAGWGGLKATATWDNGEITQTEFFFTVIDTPLYPSANYPSSNGPYLLETS